MRLAVVMVVAVVLAPAWGLAVRGPAVGAAPPDEDEALLRRALGTFLRDASTLRVEAVPDLYEGGYARISIYARGARLAESGLRIDEAWVRLVGATLNPRELRAGHFRVESVRDSSLHLRISLRSLEEHFAGGNPRSDIRLTAEDGYLVGSGTVPVNGIPTRVRLRGFFAVDGSTEVYFYIETAHVNGLPVPTPLVRRLEQQINPILTQRTWPVTFRLRSLRLGKEDLVLSSQGDGTCPACGGVGGGQAPGVNP
ncbi:MAG: LmeA family phospholipid-binding protein [Armatimonadota bacterium]|nr:LmeA family phospholipid-binding protein [Armatimonadota bacterium]MDR7491931.1 LmeA family phospholipid-binding protein [Armatimonadota bacterium]MDR7503008.1 LmeA family phospholipid-binding protein [Armatimonadota bacterium]MDR7526676.1 LmeA family phospholipid-binding protein [Armatimonadota bacterium]MDR7575430.1 LmeA family phospholipid-binding protein [Armatimonadota bacterium]